MHLSHTEGVVVGVGLAGLVTAHELLDRGCQVLVLGEAAGFGGCILTERSVGASSVQEQWHERARGTG